MSVQSNNLGQVRVVDPVLTNHMIGYRNSEFIGHCLFPFANIMQRGGRVIRFGKEDFRQVIARRAPGATTTSIQFGYESDPVALIQEALDVLIPREFIQDATQVPHIDLSIKYLNKTMKKLLLNLEIEHAALATNRDSYTAGGVEVVSGSDKWSDPASDPYQMFLDWMETVRRRIGVYPNVAEMGANVFNAIRSHPKIVNRYQHTTPDAITEDILAKLFGLREIKVGRAVYIPANAPLDANPVDIWPDTLTLAYVPESGDTGDMEEPSFGYTYRYMNHPEVEMAEWNRDRKSWQHGLTYERNPYITASDAGYLVEGLV